MSNPTSTPSLRNSNKWQVLPPVLPSPGFSNAQYQAELTMGPWAGDMDGDGCAELLCQCIVPGGHNFLLTTSFLNPGDLSPYWQQPEWGQMIQMDNRVDSVGTWPIQPGDNYVLADIDKDGQKEIFVVNDPSSLIRTVGLYKWRVAGDGANRRLTLHCLGVWEFILTGPNGQQWQLGPNDNFFPADLNGDGADEIIVSNGQAIGVLQWTSGAAGQNTGSTLSVLWAASSVPGSGIQSPWTCGSNDSYVPVTIQDASHLFAFDGASIVGVFAWNTTQLEVIWTHSSIPADGSGPAWTLSPGDTFMAVDLDLDGNQEIVVYDSVSQVGVLAWRGDYYAAVAIAGQFGNDGGPTQPFPNSAILYRMPNTAGPDYIAFWDQSANVTAVEFTGGQFNLVFELAGTIRGAAPWTLQTTDQLNFGDFDGDGYSELFLFNSGTQMAAVVKNAAVLWHAFRDIPVFDMNFITSATKIPFPTYTGSELDVYHHISLEIQKGLNVPCGNDIRSEYINLNLQGTFLSMAEFVAKLRNTGYPPHAWETVKRTVFDELTHVDPVQGLFKNFVQLANDVKNQQDHDYKACLGNVVPQPESQVTYWLGQIVVAIAWGAAAAVPDAGIGLSIFASLLGSAFGDQPATTTIGDLSGQIDQTYSNTLNNLGVTKTVLMDAGMLSALGPLAGAPWGWDPTTSEKTAHHTRNANRLQFYQLMIPPTYQVIDYLQWEYDYPSQDAQQNAPWSYWVENALGGTYNVYLLCKPGSLGSCAYPQEALMTDLLQRIRVPSEQLFLSQYGWSALPQVPLNNDGNADAVAVSRTARRHQAGSGV